MSNALLAQLVFCVVLSVVTQRGILFVSRVLFQFDFNDFYVAARAWISGANPYSATRFFTPPSSIIPALPFVILPSLVARVTFLIAHTTFLLFALKVLGRKLGLNAAEMRNVYLITLIYYPVLFLIGRGNLDGIMLALIILGFCSEGVFRKAFLFGGSIALKLYTGVWILVLLRRRRMKLALLTLAAVALLQLPFLKLEPQFVAALAGRTGVNRGFENFSPFELFNIFLGGLTAKVLYLLFWTGTLAVRLWRDRSVESDEFLFDYMPWMISLPLLVFPYEGVFLLPLLMVFAKRSRTEDLSGPEGLFTLGFILTGFQPLAITQLFGSSLYVCTLLGLVNVVGLSLIMVSITLGRGPILSANERSLALKEHLPHEPAIHEEKSGK